MAERSLGLETESIEGELSDAQCQENSPIIDAKDFAFPENTVLDLHDLVAILLHEYCHTETRFRRSKLLEIVDTNTYPTCLPVARLMTWLQMDGEPKTGYFVVDPEDTPTEDTAPVGPNDFLHPNIRCPRDLDTEDVETLFWRIKLSNDVGDLIYSLQLVLDALPTSTILRVRTSRGRSLTCPAQSFNIVEAEVYNGERVYIGRIRPYIDDSYLTPRRRAHLEDNFIREGCWSRWLYMLFGNRDTDKFNIALDPVSSLLGLRGLGGEVFTLEEEGTYRGQVLSDRIIVYASDDEFTYERINKHHPSEEFEEIGDSAEQDAVVAKRVLERLEKICRKEETYCSYCGKAKSPSRCSKCASARYCGQACQKKAWKYHKVWCKADAAAKDTDVQTPVSENPDIEMSET